MAKTNTTKQQDRPGRKVVTPNSFDHTKYKGFYNTEPSLTEPDQTMSIQMILRKYAAGEELPQKMPIYDEDPESSNGKKLKELDLVDIQELKNEYEDGLKTIEKVKEEKRKQRKEQEEQQ